MALRAQKNVGNIQPDGANDEVVQQEVEQTGVSQSPAVRQAPQAPATRGGNSAMVDLNAGILEGIEDMNTGNYVAVDGSKFVYKSAEEEVDYIDMQVTYGKRFYQWVDESDPDRKVFNNADTKLDDRYKFKFEIRWNEEREEEQLTEFTMSLSTTSAMNFVEYVKGLAKAGKGVGAVITRMTISRQKRQGSTDKYSRVEFEAFDVETGNPLNIKTPAAKAI